MIMKPQTVSKTRVMAATQSNSGKLTVLNNVVLLVGLLVLIISIKIVSGF